MATIFREPLITKREALRRDLSLLDAQHQDRLTNLLAGQDTFFAGPGMGPDYDYPNPRGRQFPVELRTWLQVANANRFAWVGKPPAAYVLDINNSLYTSLGNAWEFPEGSGSVTEDDKAGNTATLLDATWSTYGGNAVLTMALGGTGAGLSFSTVTLSGATAWTVHWRGTSVSSSGTILGRSTGGASNYIYVDGTTINFKSSAGTNYQWSRTLTSETTDYAIVNDQANALMRCYVNGTQIGSGLSITANDAGLIFDRIGSSNGLAGLSWDGVAHHVINWTRALTTSEIQSLPNTLYPLWIVGPFRPLWFENPNLRKSRFAALNQPQCNLLETTLASAPATAPFFQTEWTNPQVRRMAAWMLTPIGNLLETTLAVSTTNRLLNVRRRNP